MRVLISQGRTQGLQSISLDSSIVSLRMYEHMGFQRVRDGSHDLGGGLTLDYTMMTMDL
jgi:hypothetical protein